MTDILSKFDSLMRHLNSEENSMAEEFRELLAGKKNLYIIVSDGGDGSYYPRFTMNDDLMRKLQEAYDNDLMDYENGIGCDGDGFHYETIQVPAFVTTAMLGLGHYDLLSDNYADKFIIDEDEEGDDE